jgi:hypothetical protein
VLGFALAGVAGGLVLGLAALAVAGLLGLRSSSSSDPRNGVDANTARMTYGGGRTVEVPLDECGRDGDVVLMVGHQGSIVLQVWADLGPGGEERTGLTVDLGDDGIFGAFGPDAPPGPAGEIVSVGRVGDGLVIEGRWVRFDGDIEPTGTVPPGAEVDSLIARCPPLDETS